jgi:hypothetical protein
MTGTLHEDKYTLFDHILLNPSWNEKFLRQKVVQNIKKTHILFSVAFFKKIVLFMR